MTELDPTKTYIIFTASAVGDWYAEEIPAQTAEEAVEVLAEAIKPTFPPYLKPAAFAVHCAGCDVTAEIVAIILRRMAERMGEDAAFHDLEPGEPLADFVAYYDNGRADRQDMWDNFNALLKLNADADLGALGAI